MRRNAGHEYNEVWGMTIMSHPKGADEKLKVKPGTYAKLRMSSVLISVNLALEDAVIT